MQRKDDIAIAKETIEYILLHPEQFRIQTVISDHINVFGKLPKIDIYKDSIIGMMISLTNHAYTIHGKSKNIKIPKNWWQHLKQDLFPKFLLKRFPVQYLDLTTDIKYVVDGTQIPCNDNNIRKILIKNYSPFLINWDDYNPWREYE